MDINESQQREEQLRSASELLYRFMTESTAVDWGDHPASDWAMNLNHWDWNPGVGIIAIMEYYRVSGDGQVLHTIKSWVETNREKADHIKVINSMAPLAIFPQLYRLTKDETYLDMASRYGNWIVEEAPRTREGAFEHTVTESASFPEQVWADTLFMAVLFLARLANLLQDRRLADAALEQLVLHLRLLHDKETNVLFHGWSYVEKNHLSSARWTRANAWVVLVVPMIIQEIKDITDIPDEVIKQYKALVNGIITYQHSDGLWSTVMDIPHFYREVSGSAGIACGIAKAIRCGMLSSELLPIVERTLAGVMPYISEKGAVSGVSGGTPIMGTIEQYGQIPTFPTLYGQGLVLMFLLEMMD